MLYILELQVQHINKVITSYDVEISGSIQSMTGSVDYINQSKQIRIVEATNETTAREKVQTYYTNQNTETDTYRAIISSIAETII